MVESGHAARPGKPPSAGAGKPSFLAELRQRHMVRAAIIYAAAVWALAQGIAQLSPVFGMSERVTLWFVIACAIGFPFWLAFAWYFRFTAHGIERESEVVEDRATIRRTGRRLDYWIIGILVIAVVLLLTNELVLQRGKTMREFTAAPATGSASTPAAFAPPADSLVVLPFTNLSGDPKQRYFSDGITEELTGALGRNTGLTVIAWDTAAHYREGTATPEEIGKALNVAHIVDGSVEHQGTDVRVSAELLSTVTGRQLWSAHYDDKLQNIFAVQDRITGAIADALKVKFAGMQAVPTLDPAAHQLYLKGLAAVGRYTAEDAQAAQGYFRQALKLDPDYADAWALLAGAEIELTEVSSRSLKDALPKARAAAEKALALDPRNANAWEVLGYADESDRRVAQAIAEFRQALALDPNNVYAHLDYGLLLPLKQSLAQFREAARLDPDSAVVQLDVALDYGDLGDWQAELAAAQAMIKAAPHNIAGAFFLASAYTHLQRSQDAIRAFDRVQPTTPLDRQLLDAGRLTYRALAKPALRPKALAALEQLHRAKTGHHSQGYLTPLFLALGDKETAMRMLPGHCGADPLGCADLALNRAYAPLRGDPRFEKLAKQYTTITAGTAAAAATSR